MSHVHGREGHHYFSDAVPLPGDGRESEYTFVAGPRPLPEHLWDDHLDRLATLAANMTGCPVARISIFDHSHVICRASIGAPRLIVPRPQSFCARAMSIGGTVISDNPSVDERFYDLATLPHNQGVRFYLAHPMINADGVVIGILSLRDVLPHTMDQTQLAVLSDIAALATDRLTSHPLPVSGGKGTADEASGYLSMVERMAGIGYWRCLPKVGHRFSYNLELSAAARKILGWDTQSPKNYYGFLHALPREERQRVAARIHRAIRRSIPFTIEVSLLAPTGKRPQKVSIHGEFSIEGILSGLIWEVH